MEKGEEEKERNVKKVKGEDLESEEEKMMRRAMKKL